MSMDLVMEAGEAIAPESPQPLPLTANSSRCTSPLSPPSDHNASASSVDDREEEGTLINDTLNLSLPSKASSFLLSSNNNHKLAQQLTTTVSNHHINHTDPNGTMRSNHKFKSDISSFAQSSSSASRGKSKHTNPISLVGDGASIPNPQSPDFVQLLLEYRQVLLDVLAKSILLADNEVGDSGSKSVTLPLKCTCGFTSKLSNQITRSSTYVHQLELRFRSLMESSRTNESKYTPKRPWFINSAPFGTSYPFSGKSSLLNKKPSLSRQQPGGGKQVSLFRSGTSSMNSSLNGDEDEVDSDDDVNDSNLAGRSLNTNNLNNVSIEELNGGGKTILEGYLESMKNVPSEDGSESDDEKDLNGDDEDYDETNDPRKRIDSKTKKLVFQMQRSGLSISTISRQIGISRKSVRRIVSTAMGFFEKKRQESRNQKGANGLLLPNGGGPISLQNLYADAMDDDMDEEKEMIVDEDAADDEDDEQDLKDEEDTANDNLPVKGDLDDAKMVPTAYPLALTKPHIKPRKNMSLIHNAFNGTFGASSQHSPQQTQLSNGNLMNSHLSLIHHQSERFKPFDMKVRHNTSTELLNASHHRISKSNQIVPQVAAAAAAAKMYSAQRHQQQQHAIRLNNSNNHSSRNENHHYQQHSQQQYQHHRMKISKSSRHSNEISLKESIMIPEADKNNNTTLANCNLTITSSSSHTNGSGSNSNNGHQHSPNESNSLLPPIPTSLADSNSDSEANLVPRSFVDGFPAGIMNSLNPNRATKLTLEDFNIVWQLRSQHWTHNQIRKYFEQRGKSISKSSISRIMNGKQRNFQQFFNVIPSSL